MAEYLGDSVDVPCPDCGGQVVYNGNYFCVEESPDSPTTGCGWALPSDLPRSQKDEQLFERMYASLMEYRRARGKT